MLLRLFVFSGLLMMANQAAMANNFMDEEWAKQICTAWNNNETLTKQLFNSDEEDDGESYSWVGNDAGRGYKLIQFYRTECGETTKMQMNIVAKDDKAMCEVGGKPDGKVMDYSVDYLMHAKDQHWTCMGEGKFGCGAVGAMMSGKLKFQGPKMEAMSVMGPFESFLRLTGTVAGEKGEENCPK